MFNFKSKKLNPVTADLVSKFEKASAIANPTERVEALMLLKEEAHKKFREVSRPEQSSALAGVGLILVGHLAAMPLVMGAGLLWVGKKFLNDMRASGDKNVLFTKLDAAVSEVVNHNIQDATASPAFLKSLKSSFRSATKGSEKAFADMMKRTKPPSAPGPGAN